MFYLKTKRFPALIPQGSHSEDGQEALLFTIILGDYYFQSSLENNPGSNKYSARGLKLGKGIISPEIWNHSFDGRVDSY